MRTLILIYSALLAGCVSSPPTETVVPIPQTEISREIGRHELPFQPNERFILYSVGSEPGVYENPSLVMVYFLDAKRREWKMGGPRSTDGYVTELGWFMEGSPDDRSIMEERVILLPTGEQITVVGNTVQRGEARLRTLESSEPVKFGRSSLAPSVKD